MDKRRHPRFDGNGLDADLKVDGGRMNGAVIENVSLGGALIGLAGTCSSGKNVLLELRSPGRRTLRLVGRVIGALPKGHGRSRPGVRIRFNPSSATSTAELYAMIRSLPRDAEIEARPTDPEAFEFHSITLSESEDAPTDIDIDIDVDIVEPEEEVVIELKDVVDDEPTVIVAAMEQELQSRAMRIQELERQLAAVRRNARTLEDVQVPAALAS